MSAKLLATGLLLAVTGVVSLGNVIVNDNGGAGCTVSYSAGDKRCDMIVEGVKIELGQYSNGGGFVHRWPEPYTNRYCTTSFLPESTVISDSTVSWCGSDSNVMLDFDPASVIGLYVGLKWNDGKNWFYGWATISSVDASSYLVSKWAYESTPNAAIATGAVPEPATLLLLAVGGIALLRSKMKK